MNAFMRHALVIVLALAASSTWAQVYPPTPKAGKQLTQDYLTQNLVYPDDDLEAGRSGKVVVAFHVDETGQCSDYTIKESFSDAASDVALTLVERILWDPATKDQLPTAYDMEYPVEFNAKAYKRYWKRHTRVTVPLTLEADDSHKIYETRALEEAAKPYFADGSNMGKYILTNLRYPEAAKATEVSGTVRLGFIVETDGSVSNILVVNSVGGGCDNEAIRLLQETQWIPAVKNGKYVRSHNVQDITFNIGNRNYQDGNSY